MQPAITLQQSPKSVDIRQTQRPDQQYCLTEKPRSSGVVLGHRGWLRGGGFSESLCTATRASEVNPTPLAACQTSRIPVAACKHSSTIDSIVGEPLICMCSPMNKNLEAKPMVTAPLLCMAGGDLSPGEDLDYCLGTARAGAAC